MKQAKSLISQLTEAEFVESKIPGYRWSQQHSDYAGIPQRWLVVESTQRREADLRQIEKEIQKLEQEARQKLKQLSDQKFACGPDALAAALQLSRKFKYHIAFLRKMRYDWALAKQGIGHWALGIGHTSLL